MKNFKEEKYETHQCFKCNMDSDVIFHTKTDKIKKSVGDDIILEVSRCFVIEGKIDKLICDMITLKSDNGLVVIPRENVTKIGIQDES